MAWRRVSTVLNGMAGVHAACLGETWVIREPRRVVAIRYGHDGLAWVVPMDPVSLVNTPLLVGGMGDVAVTVVEYGRRGMPRVLAMDAQSGEVVWSTELWIQGLSQRGICAWDGRFWFHGSEERGAGLAIGLDPVDGHVSGVIRVPMGQGMVAAADHLLFTGLDGLYAVPSGSLEPSMWSNEPIVDACARGGTVIGWRRRIGAEGALMAFDQSTGAVSGVYDGWSRLGFPWPMAMFGEGGRLLVGVEDEPRILDVCAGKALASLELPVPKSKVMGVVGTELGPVVFLQKDGGPVTAHVFDVDGRHVEKLPWQRHGRVIPFSAGFHVLMLSHGVDLLEG